MSSRRDLKLSVLRRWATLPQKLGLSGGMPHGKQQGSSRACLQMLRLRRSVATLALSCLCKCVSRLMLVCRLS